MVYCEYHLEYHNGVKRKLLCESHKIDGKGKSWHDWIKEKK